MGITIVVNQAPAGSAYDQWKIYRATTKTGEYSVIATRNLTDPSYYDTTGTSTHWYKVSYYDSVNEVESALTDPLQGFATTYTDVNKVAGRLQMASITDSTSPSIQDVIILISEAEDEIDNQTGHAWRTRYSGTKSGKNQTAAYEYHDIQGDFKYQTGVPIKLKHRMVKDFDADEGDAFEIWDGASWQDYIANYTEGRGNDWWGEYDGGWVYVRTLAGIRGPIKARFKYRYGETYVPGEIQKLATKMVLYEMLFGADREEIIIEGGAGLSTQQKVDLLQKQIDKTIAKFAEFRPIEQSM